MDDGVWDGEDISHAVDGLTSVGAFIGGASQPDGDLTTADTRAPPVSGRLLLVGAVCDAWRVADVAEVESPDNQRCRDASRLTTEHNSITVLRCLFTRWSHCDPRQS